MISSFIVLIDNFQKVKGQLTLISEVLFMGADILDAESNKKFQQSFLDNVNLSVHKHQPKFSYQWLRGLVIFKNDF